MTVNHSENFVDPVTGAHTQNIKSGWNQVKFDIKAGNGMSRDPLEDYLILHEAMWRNRFNKGSLKETLKNLSHTSPPTNIMKL